jgi:uncharacterized protein
VEKGFLRSLLFLCVLALAGGGCTTVQRYDDQFRPVYSTYRQGNAEAAAQLASSKTYQRRFKSNDRLLWTLETAKMHHTAGNFAESNRLFEQAEEIIADFEQRATYNVRAGLANLGAVATNPAALPYRGTYAEKILVNTYKAMNYLGLGDLEAARVEIRRSYERQREAILQNEAAIAEAQKTAAARNIPSRSALDSPALRKAVEVDTDVAAAYANFSNPFTTFLSGLVYMADEDPARAEVDFRLLASLPLPNRFVQQELELVEKHLRGEAQLPRRRVYVVFENGLGPVREEMRVDLILPQIGYTGFAFPQISFQPTSVSSLRVTLSGDEDPVHTERVASIDQIVATDFQTQMPAMALRTLTSVVAKEVVAKQLTDELDIFGLLIGSVYKAVVNRADTRTWQTLGKEFQIAAFDHPESGSLRLSLAGPNKNELSTRQEVKLPEGDIVLLLVRSVNSNDLRVTTRTLR